MYMFVQMNRCTYAKVKGDSRLVHRTVVFQVKSFSNAELTFFLLNFQCRMNWAVFKTNTDILNVVWAFIKNMLFIYWCSEAVLVQVVSFYPSIGSQVLLVAQFKRFFLLFLPIVPSEQTEALPAAQKPANSLQRHSNQVKCVVFFYPGR